MLALLAGTVAPAGCVAHRLPYSLDVPAVILAPIARGGVEDGRGRFREIYCAVRQRAGAWPDGGRSCDAELVRLADEPEPTGRPVDLGGARVPLRVLVVPGLFGDCLPVTAFAEGLERLRSLGYATEVIEVGGFSSVATNAARIRDALAALAPAPGERLVAVSYSKGTPDLLQALVAYPEVRERVAALVSVAGVVAGTPLASEAVSNPLLAAAAELTSLACARRESETLVDLGRSARLLWLSRNRLPPSVRYYSLTGFGERDRISRILHTGYDILARIDPRNDGAVIYSDAILPGGTLLGFAHADHWAIALALPRDPSHAIAIGLDRNDFPRAALLEAAIRLVEEDLLAQR